MLCRSSVRQVIENVKKNILFKIQQNIAYFKAFWQKYLQQPAFTAIPANATCTLFSFLVSK